MIDSAFHLIEPPGVLVKQCQIQPGIRIAVADFDRRTIFVLSVSKVFFLLRNPRVHPVGLSGIKPRQGGGLCPGFILTTTNDAGGLKVELR